MIFEVGKEIIIPFLIVDAGNTPVTSGVNPTCTIKRSDGKYWNGITSVWVDTIYDNAMSHTFRGTYVFSFTPQTEDFFIVRCSESVYYKIEDGVAFRTVSRLSNLDLLDESISSRLATSNFDNKIDIVDANVDTINSNIGNIKNIVDTNLDATVSSRSIVTDESIWSYDVRTLSPTSVDGIGAYTVVITVTKDSIVESGVNVYVYDTDRIARLSGITDENGQVLFKINSGNFYFEFRKQGLWDKEIIENISDNTEINVNMSPISNDENLLVNFRELDNSINFEVDAVVPIGIEAYSNNTFTINSATVSVTGVDEPIVCRVSNKRIYGNIPIVQEGWIIIKFDVIINGYTYKYELPRRYVD